MARLDFHSIIEYCLEFINELSTKGLYIILLLFYAYQQGEVPSWAKKVIIGSITYFLSPLDAIPDLTPVLGMTDDLGVLAFGLVTIACYVTDDIREKAESKLTKLTKKKINRDLINEVNSWL